MVEFMFPDGEYPMVPDDSTDEMKAMAMVNTKMMVSANMVAAITPMFVEGASPVGVMPGEDNMPFQFVSWSAMQSHVIEKGATFAIHKASIGANQEMMPTGDAMYITCGPFACQDGDMPPEVTIDDSMACMAWDPTLELQVGLIDNSLDEHVGTAAVTGDAPAAPVTVFDGLDLGWHYTSSLAVDITHDLVVTSKKGSAKKASTPTSLAVSSVGAITLGAEAAGGQDQTYYALSAEPDETRMGVEGDDVGSCQPVGSNEQGLWSYNDNLVSRLSQPDHCFRITVDDGLGRNYLDAYSVTMAPQGANVSWGKIAWKAWKDFTCPEMSFEAAEQVDVCAMFAEEVDRLPMPKAIPVTTTDDDNGRSNLEAINGITLAGFNLEFPKAAENRHRFTAMWYSRGKGDVPNLYDDGDDEGDNPQNMVVGTTEGDSSTIRGAWVATLDKDYDPMYGDLGKVDTMGDDEADNFVDSDDSNDCTADDGGSAATGKDGADMNGTLCNASQTIETSVTFPLGLGYDCGDAVKKTYTLTCDWNARGNRTNSVNVNQTGITTGDDSNIDDFVKCTVE